MPPHLPRREFRHEPESTTCGCGTPMQRIGEDVAEKLDYKPGVFTVERHVGLRVLRAIDAGTCGAAHHRQGLAHHRAAGSGVGSQSALNKLPPRMNAGVSG